MITREVTIAGHKVAAAEAGQGPSLIYLHGFADIHAASVGWLPFHEELAKSFRVIAPAHPGCAGSEEDESIENIDDVAFRYLELLDELKLDRVNLAGTCFGGWIAAELAVRHPERVNRLALIGPSGLFIPGKPIGDLFWEIQSENMTEYRGLRKLMFARADSPAALALFPDGRSSMDIELSRYKAMRFCSRVGFNPPYFYNRKLQQRLARYKGPALVVAGESDHMVPVEHARAYQAALKGAKLAMLPGCGHSPQVENPAETASLLRSFFKD
jgi:pimeloyl-ACP methyl ester carboxylesterase